MSVETPVTTQPNETQHPHHPEISEPPKVTPAPAGRGSILIGAALLILITAALVTFINRKGETDALAKDTDVISVPTVAVTHA